MPLLGVGYVMTLLVNPTVRSIGVPLLVAASDAMEAVITSTQGFVISLPYCFLNSEVQGVVRSHWSRWRMVRTVGKNNTTRANSVSTNATYYINQKSGVQVAYQRKNTETIWLGFLMKKWIWCRDNNWYVSFSACWCETCRQPDRDFDFSRCWREPEGAEGGGGDNFPRKPQEYKRPKPIPYNWISLS